MWESGRDFQGVWEGWKAGFLAFHAFHTLSFPWPALERVSQSHYSSRRPVVGTGTTCPKCRLERSRWRGGHCLGVERLAVVAEVRLGHKEGGSCDPFTQEDAGRTPAAQLLRGHDPSLSAGSRAVCRTFW